MRQFLSGIALAAALGLGPVAMPVAAQNAFSPLVYINDQAVTRYEVDQRLRFMQLLQAPNATPAGAEAELVNDRLKMFAARQMGIAPSDADIQAGLDEFAGRAGMSSAEFITALGRAGVERQAYRDFVTAGVVWREVIRRRIVPGVNISDAEVERALTREIETPVISRVLLSEIVIPAPDGQEGAAQARAQQILASSSNEAGFAAAARQYSASGTSSRGGRLEWVELDNLPPALRQIVSALRPGQMTQPLNVPGAVVLLMLRDAQGQLRPGAREQVLDYAVLRVADAATAADITARVDTCNDLQARGAGATQRQTASQGAIPGLVAAQLAALDPGETATVNTGLGIEIIMLCSRQPALLAQDQVATTALPPDGVEAGVAGANPAALPDRAAMRDQLFNQKINVMADAYLAELRADAVIRRP
ncbi:MAG: peptidylprolyl isomerase [Paracoccus sp. (in: a-proteobacteria)]|uniref:peptidylprolyl isomerase n=1 Tax=Paracoccus sp. TaxID=267 RepID=UPI0026E0D0FF|nr:peptidylprolyl isomerase [Paracoccus sp. (in: a-proteobacteria)]MDO5633123.1 peptidylprolyl isomerase [Paracoccus sp. (in: a-proteobacteria)]